MLTLISSRFLYLSSDTWHISLFFLIYNKQVQGRDRLVLKEIGDQLGLEGSYIPRTYIEQIQLERLVNEVMVCLLTIC